MIKIDNYSSRFRRMYAVSRKHGLDLRLNHAAYEHVAFDVIMRIKKGIFPFRQYTVLFDPASHARIRLRDIIGRRNTP